MVFNAGAVYIQPWLCPLSTQFSRPTGLSAKSTVLCQRELVVESDQAFSKLGLSTIIYLSSLSLGGSLANLFTMGAYWKRTSLKRSTSIYSECQ